VAAPIFLLVGPWPTGSAAPEQHFTSMNGTHDLSSALFVNAVAEADDASSTEGRCGKNTCIERGNDHWSRVDQYPEEILPGYPGTEFFFPGQGRNVHKSAKLDEYNDGTPQVLQPPLSHKWYLHLVAAVYLWICNISTAIVFSVSFLCRRHLVFAFSVHVSVCLSWESFVSVIFHKPLGIISPNLQLWCTGGHRWTV